MLATICSGVAGRLREAAACVNPIIFYTPRATGRVKYNRATKNLHRATFTHAYCTANDLTTFVQSQAKEPGSFGSLSTLGSQGSTRRYGYSKTWRSEGSLGVRFLAPFRS